MKQKYHNLENILMPAPHIGWASHLHYYHGDRVDSVLLFCWTFVG